jgi:hypothetical protein
LALAACDNGTTIEERQPVTYSGTTNNATYTLTISPASGRAAYLEGDDYMLIVERGGSEKTGAGKVKDVNDNVFVLQPSVENAPPFNVATSDTSIVNISGTITHTDRTSESGPGSITTGGNNQGGNNQGSNNQGDNNQGNQGTHTHRWGAWTVTTPVTCTTPGIETRVCSLDRSHTETRVIASLGHNWGEWAATTAPTATQNGVETRTCARDSSHKETRTAYATGTPGLQFVLVNNGAAYSVNKGTVTNGAVYVPAWHRLDSNNEYLPVTEIGYFLNTNITAITIPSSVKSISQGAFQHTDLISVTIPSSVTSMGNSAFQFWTATQTINVQGHASEEAADATWGQGWQGGSNATVIYQG